MTFPSLGGNLPDPWIDGALVNAAAMKTRTTDPLNALADALLVKTARVTARFNCTTVAVPHNAPTSVVVSSITSSTGGTFSISGGNIVAPAPGIYNFRISGQYTTVLPTPTPNYFLGYPILAVDSSDYAFYGVTQQGGQAFVFSGSLELKAGGLAAMLQAYQASGTSRTIDTLKGALTKVSD